MKTNEDLVYLNTRSKRIKDQFLHCVKKSDKNYEIIFRAKKNDSLEFIWYSLEIRQMAELVYVILLIITEAFSGFILEEL